MTEHDILLIQVATGATGYSEKYVNIPKGGILTSDANQTPVVVPMGATGTIPIADPTATGGIRWGVGGAGPTGPTGHTGPTGAASTVPGPTGATGATGATGPTGTMATKVTINDQTGTTYTLVLTDAGKYIRCENANAITVTVPKNSVVAFETGTVITIEQKGAGTVTVAPVDVDVTLNAYDGLSTYGQYAGLQLVKVDTNVWTCIAGIG